MNGRNTIHECTRCPHLATSHGLVKGAPIDGPYRCRYCDCEMFRSDPSRRISQAEMRRLHAEELAE